MRYLLAIWIGRLAVETGAFPLYEVVNGRYKLSYDKELRPVSEYLNGQGRFRHLTDEMIDLIQKRTTKEYENLRVLAGLKKTD